MGKNNQDGVYTGGKRSRRIKALGRLEKDLEYYENALDNIQRVEKNTSLGKMIKEEAEDKASEQIARIKSEIATLKSRI